MKRKLPEIVIDKKVYLIDVANIRFVEKNNPTNILLFAAFAEREGSFLPSQYVPKFKHRKTVKTKLVKNRTNNRKISGKGL